MKKHSWKRGEYLCLCGVWRHKTTAAHPEYPSQWLYSLDGEHWRPEPIAHVPATPKEKS